jgi:hypothetical protein
MATEQPEDLGVRSTYAALEQAYIEEYLRSQGASLAKLHDLPEPRRRTLMRDASAYASMKLSEVEARSHLIEEMHGGPHPM